MTPRQHYSVRTGQGKQKLDLPLLRQLFENLYRDFEERGYFQEYLGFYCIDAHEVPGRLGKNINSTLITLVRKSHLWPVGPNIDKYSEEDVLDMIEFLYDNVSLPVKGDYHDWNDCGWHFTDFDKVVGQAEFRDRVNAFLNDYEDGFQLSETGNVNHMIDSGLTPLFQEPLPPCDAQNVGDHIGQAKSKFLRFKASATDKRDAVRELAGVFEYLRPELQKVLTNKDEGDLFNIANNFHIRHHNASQKGQYDEDVWLDWMFYYYLATAQAALRLIEKATT